MLALYRAATGPRAGAGSIGAYAGLQPVPDAASRDGARIAVADAGHAGGRRSAAVAAGAISGADSPVDAMDLGSSVRPGGDGSVRAVYRLHRALGAAIGAGGIWEHEF